MQKRGKELVETLKTAKKEYGNPVSSPNPSILDALKLMVAKVEKYNLGNLGKNGQIWSVIKVLLLISTKILMLYLNS